MKYRNTLLAKGLVLLLLLAAHSGMGQSHLQPNEKLILSFVTKEDKTVEVAIDTTHEYMVYRYTSLDSVEYEFPQDKATAWELFEFSWYLRSGGLANEGTDLNYLYFEDGHTKYVIYQVYTNRTDETDYGVKEIDLMTKVTREIQGFSNTAKGSLIDLRKVEELRKGQEIFH